MKSVPTSKGVLHQVRKTLGFTQVEAAKILGINQSAFSKRERGEGDIATIARLVEARGFQAFIIIGNEPASIIPITKT